MSSSTGGREASLVYHDQCRSRPRCLSEIAATFCPADSLTEERLFRGVKSMPGLTLIPHSLAFLLLFTSVMTIIAGTSSAHRRQRAVADTSPPQDTIVIDTIGDLPTSTRFERSGSAGSGLNDRYNGGPEFTLTKPTTITEIGAYLNICCPENLERPQPIPSVYVNIHPQLNGKPDADTVIAFYALSNDNDPKLISYESVKVELRLEPGTYYAIFNNPGKSGMILWKATYPVEYRGRYVPMGFISKKGEEVCPMREYPAVRILKKPN